MKMTLIDRVLLLLTSLLAGYQVAVGINGLDTIPIIVYTIGFGVLLVAALLMIILGFEVLDSPIVAVISTIIPLSLALGLMWEHAASYRVTYLLFSIIGFLAVSITRSIPVKDKLPTIVLAIVHGIAGMTIFLLPSILAADGKMDPAFALVGLAGALMGLGGLLLSFLKAGKPVVPRETILRILPGLLLLMAVCFVAGFKFG
jgi:hypothetical protein